MTALTPEQFTEELEKIITEYYWDLETMHSKADELMCRILRELGYNDGVAMFDEMPKWYA